MSRPRFGPLRAPALAAQAVGKPGHVEPDLELHLTTVGAREPLEGVGLPVGKPTLLRRDLATRVRLEHI